MWVYKQLKNIKTALFFIAMAMIISLFFYNQSIINSLRNDSRKTMNLYAELIVKGITESNDVELDFVFSEIIQKVTFPIIQSDTLGNPVIWKNLNDENTLSKNERAEIREQMESVRQSMKGQDAQALKAKLDILGDLTRTLADNAMGSKILAELKDDENMI